MPIPVNCDCGRSLRIKDELAGRKVYCPACKAVLFVPQRVCAETTDLEIVEDEEEEAGYEVVDDDQPRKKRSRADDEEGVQTAPRPGRSGRDVDDEEGDEDDEISQRERVRRKEERAREREERREEEDREERRRKRRRRERVSQLEEQGRFNVEGSRGYFGSTNAGVAGGLVMIVLGIVGVGVGLAAGYICFWPIILVVVGIIAVIKGLAS